MTTDTVRPELWAYTVADNMKPIVEFDTTWTYFQNVANITRGLKKAGLSVAAQRFAADAEQLARDTNHDTGYLYMLALNYVYTHDPAEDITDPA